VGLRGPASSGMTPPHDRDPSSTPGPGGFPRTASPGYQVGSEEPASPERPSEAPTDQDDERIDPYVAYAQAASKAREREKSAGRPGIWLPGPEELDREPGLEDRETRFSRDAYGGRGNPQVSVRLRPRDFRRLREAADLYGVRPTTLARMMVIRGVTAILDAELRRDGEYLREN
jgi:hypothetical protein